MPLSALPQQAHPILPDQPEASAPMSLILYSETLVHKLAASLAAVDRAALLFLPAGIAFSSL